MGHVFKLPEGVRLPDLHQRGAGVGGRTRRVGTLGQRAEFTQCRAQAAQADAQLVHVFLGAAAGAHFAGIAEHLVQRGADGGLRHGMAAHVMRQHGRTGLHRRTEAPLLHQVDPAARLGAGVEPQVAVGPPAGGQREERADARSRSPRRAHRPQAAGLASAMIDEISAAGSTGLAMCIWKPALRALAASSARAKAVSAMAGMRRQASLSQARTRRISS